MKRIALMTAATLSLTAPAFAYTGVSPTMVSNVESILAEVGYSNVAVTTLSDEQVVEIYAAGQRESQSEQIGLIKAALDGKGMGAGITERRVVLTTADERGLQPMGESSVVNSVQTFLDNEGFSVDASALTDAQVAELYFLAFSTDDASDRDEIETILNM